MARQKWTHGAIVRIRIDDDYHTYGRLLRSPMLAVYDCKRKEDLEAKEVIKRPVLFVVAVYHQGITSGRWVKVGKVSPGAAEVSIPDRFSQDLGDWRRCEIIDANWNVRIATPDECEGLEDVSVWEAEHVEERLRDYYADRRNVNIAYMKPIRGDQKAAREKLKSETIVKISFDGNIHTYGRLLKPSNAVAVYDCRTNRDLGLNEILSRPVLFVVSFYEWAITTDRWPRVGEAPLGKREIPIPDRFYQDYFHPERCTIIDIATGRTRSATPDKCEGLERATIWEPQDVEERIRDHYAGRTNRTLEYWRLRYPSKTEPPKPDSEKRGIDFGIRRKARMGPGKSLNDYGYDELKKFFIHMWELVLQQLPSEVSDESDPVKSLELAEQESMAVAKKGVVLGIQDIVYAAKDIDKGKRKEYDKYLKAKGALTFTEVKSTVLRQLSNILGRGKIQSEEEYYLLKEAITDVDDPQLSRRDREAVEQLLADFEDKIGRG